MPSAITPTTPTTNHPPKNKISTTSSFPPSSPSSQMHKTLLRTTHRFLSTFSPPSTTSPASINPLNLHFTTSKSYTHSIGPASFVSSKKSLAGPKTAVEFAKHLEGMSEAFVRSTWWIRSSGGADAGAGGEVGKGAGAGAAFEGGAVAPASAASEDEAGEEDIAIDVEKKVVVVSVVHRMVVKGDGDEEARTVDSEVTWWLKMSEDGKLVERSREVVDGVAAGEVGRLVAGWRGEDRGRGRE